MVVQSSQIGSCNYTMVVYVDRNVVYYISL